MAFDKCINKEEIERTLSAFDWAASKIVYTEQDNDW